METLTKKDEENIGGLSVGAEVVSRQSVEIKRECRDFDHSTYVDFSLFKGIQQTKEKKQGKFSLLKESNWWFIWGNYIRKNNERVCFLKGML